MYHSLVVSHMFQKQQDELRELGCATYRGSHNIIWASPSQITGIVPPTSVDVDGQSLMVFFPVTSLRRWICSCVGAPCSGGIIGACQKKQKVIKFIHYLFHCVKTLQELALFYAEGGFFLVTNSIQLSFIIIINITYCFSVPVWNLANSYHFFWLARRQNQRWWPIALAFRPIN